MDMKAEYRKSLDALKCAASFFDNADPEFVDAAIAYLNYCEAYSKAIFNILNEKGIG
jgi:hypothetical protein